VSMDHLLNVTGVSKIFTLHTQGGAQITALNNVEINVKAGECVALFGPSGVGKSTLLRLLYGNYSAQSGSISINHKDQIVDLVNAPPRVILDIRKHTIGYVSQFLRVIPRVPAVEVVAEPLLSRGWPHEKAINRAEELLDRMRLPRGLWSLSPVTFSGGEQQRVNLARGFAARFPLMLLDEPTASLDRNNRIRVVALIDEAKSNGAALLGIFHDDDIRERVSDRVYEMKPCQSN
jgi:alpha-D-ribose 1-methylphosphonate 5-triphosphate synthase subunit PhnL